MTNISLSFPGFGTIFDFTQKFDSKMRQVARQMEALNNAQHFFIGSSRGDIHIRIVYGYSGSYIEATYKVTHYLYLSFGIKSKAES